MKEFCVWVEPQYKNAYVHFDTNNCEEAIREGRCAKMGMREEEAVWVEDSSGNLVAMNSEL